MSGPAPRTWVRILTLALLGAMGAGVGVRPVSAMGCHAAEKPTLGLDFVKPAPHDLGAFARSPAWAPKRCTGDVPTVPERLAPTPPSGGLLCKALPPSLGPSSPFDRDSDRSLPSQTPACPERPPRASA